MVSVKLSSQELSGQGDKTTPQPVSYQEKTSPEQAQPEQKWYQSTLIRVCSFILIVEACERLCYYTFSGSQKAFLQQAGYSNFQSSSINAVFSMLSYVTTILGGFVADSYLGRYKTIVLFSFIYVVGVCVTVVTSIPSIMNVQLYLVGTLMLVSLGTGGIKANINNFGADQYDLRIPGEQAEQERFFSYFYMVINIGAAVAYGYLVTLASSGHPPGIPKEYGFMSAYSIAACCMIIAVAVFLLGTPRYTKKLVEGNSLGGLAYYIWACAFKSGQRSLKGFLSFVGWICLWLSIIMALVQAFITYEWLGFLTLGIGAIAVILLAGCHFRNDHLDGCEDQTFLTVKDAKMFLDTVPIIMVGNMAFQCAYNTMMNVLMSQACQMDLRVGGGQINGAFFNIADCFAIIIFTPVLEKGLYPLLEMVQHKPVSRTQKLVGGLVITVAAMAIAAVLEITRRSADVLEGVSSDCAPLTEEGLGVYMSNQAAWWIFIPFGLIGIAEIMVNPVLYFFTYTQTPFNTRSLAMAFVLMVQGSLSNVFSSAFSTALQRYYTDDLNDGHLEYFYYLAGSMAVVGIPAYILTDRQFIEKKFDGRGDDRLANANDGESIVELCGHISAEDKVVLV
ncbi:hypothetical protein SARC_04305 [Sphaeroforma arctica JP610]|uniref:Major facilitator superfamily (MFS) profile domain-containing protein n=1 Tax=Sphaeroforma arctica JP610 TaxID=667725 RepID=A0A0L0G2Y3_9EUKA|nr:hypothetical protein SARC_04305 [Sphaeroforma arctica JP610]KNC83440.1 hypothetical protein SARC_04305 [Sphaeroforma arctica JP610]|eukprot:XP_014157342.1 hypothetical protein SARC_04305 [Sphaeroforma arctica JP610]